MMNLVTVHLARTVGELGAKRRERVLPVWRILDSAQP